MDINNLLKNNNIAIFVKIELNNRRFNIIKQDTALESYDLFNQLILFNTIDNLKSSLSGQNLPGIWTQGKTKCVTCSPNDEEIILLFYDTDMDEKDNYYHAKHLNSIITSFFKTPVIDMPHSSELASTPP